MVSLLQLLPKLASSKDITNTCLRSPLETRLGTTETPSIQLKQPDKFGTYPWSLFNQNRVNRLIIMDVFF